MNASCKRCCSPCCSPHLERLRRGEEGAAWMVHSDICESLISELYNKYNTSQCLPNIQIVVVVVMYVCDVKHVEAWIVLPIPGFRILTCVHCTLGTYVVVLKY